VTWAVVAGGEGGLEGLRVGMRRRGGEGGGELGVGGGPGGGRGGGRSGKEVVVAVGFVLRLPEVDRAGDRQEGGEGRDEEAGEEMPTPDGAVEGGGGGSRGW